MLKMSRGNCGLTILCHAECLSLVQSHIGDFEASGWECFLKETGTVLGENFYTVFCFVIASRRNDKVPFYTTLNQLNRPQKDH